MKKITPLLCAICMLLLTGCGLSIYDDWKNSDSKALTGAGAVAGKDYINGLVPSENSRKYFAKLSSANNQPIETVSRTDNQSSQSGVRFVKNGGIAIPPGVTISFTNKGYCMDPHLPAPKAGEEYQLVPVTKLIPEDLQGTYKKLVQKASAGDTNIQSNMQHLIWALRTAGTDAAYANNLTANQKRILDRCSEYSGQFEEFNANAKANSKMIKELLGVADSYLNVKIGGVTYKASDLLDPDIGNKKINEHLNQLITMSKSLPVERSGFNYGELQPGIYTDVRGSGFLQYTAKIANSTNKEFIFYPTDYAGQVGSGTKSQGLTFFATANTSQRQRVTGGDPDKVEVDDQREIENKCPPHNWTIANEKSNDFYNEQQTIRKQYHQQILNKRSMLNNQLVGLDKSPGLEYGSTIYYLNGEIHTTKISSGNYAYEFSKGEKNIQRVSLEDDGQYYIVYKNGKYMKKKTNSKYGDYSHLEASTGELGYDPSFPSKVWAVYFNTYQLWHSASWNPDKVSLPPEAIPIEYVHLHPTESKLSFQDLKIASKRGVNITVVTPSGKTTTFNPESFSYYSPDVSPDKLQKDYQDIEKDLFKHATFKCTKCNINK